MIHWFQIHKWTYLFLQSPSEIRFNYGLKIGKRSRPICKVLDFYILQIKVLNLLDQRFKVLNILDQQHSNVSSSSPLKILLHSTVSCFQVIFKMNNICPNFLRMLESIFIMLKRKLFYFLINLHMSIIGWCINHIDHIAKPSKMPKIIHIIIIKLELAESEKHVAMLITLFGKMELRNKGPLAWRSLLFAHVECG